VLGRYQGLGPEPYWFAWGKLRFDPMFPRLRELVGGARRLLDLGCGYGVPAVWLLAQQASLQVTAIESDPDRARVAEWAMGERGSVIPMSLWELPRSLGGYDRVLLIDVLHYLPDATVGELLTRVRAKLEPGGLLLVRDTVPSPKAFAWGRRLEGWRLGRRGLLARFRSTSSFCPRSVRLDSKLVSSSYPGGKRPGFSGVRVERPPATKRRARLGPARQPELDRVGASIRFGTAARTTRSTSGLHDGRDFSESATSRRERGRRGVAGGPWLMAMALAFLAAG
jgi:SAM-dependent methyltransferase